jgi:hypothetical protein
MMMCSHLTDGCVLEERHFKKQHDLSHGCTTRTTKRGEANREERIASKETRKQGKVYVISVTLPVHPRE